MKFKLKFKKHIFSGLSRLFLGELPVSPNVFPQVLHLFSFFGILAITEFLSQRWELEIFLERRNLLMASLAIQAVTFNIRYDCGRDGCNNFSFRKGHILQTIRDRQPDVIGFQEVLPHVMTWLQDHLEQYHVVGCGRGAHYDDEHMAIAYRKDRFDLFALDTFWLSPTPFVPGSRYENQSDNPRICTCATLKDRNFPQPFRVYVTHLDDQGASARCQGISQVLARMKEDRERLSMPIILMGDFNAHPDEEELRLVGACPFLRDVTSRFPYTFHGFGDESAFEKIDYIFVSSEWAPGKVSLWKDCWDGVYLSDHYPISAQLTLPE